MRGVLTIVLLGAAVTLVDCEVPSPRCHLNQDDTEEVSCIPGYVCYRSEWNVSSAHAPAEPCQRGDNTSCIKPQYNDICSDLTITFTSMNCKGFSRTRSISVDFLNPGEIQQTFANKLPVQIETKLPPNCESLTVDHSCWESGKPEEFKTLSELKPSTDYSCVGHIKDNNVPIKNTTAIHVRIDCAPELNLKRIIATNTSMDMSWTIASTCLPPHHLMRLSCECSCSSRTATWTSAVTGSFDKNQVQCRNYGLVPYAKYTCQGQVSYNDQIIVRSAEVQEWTTVGIPEDIGRLTVTSVKNVIKVTCDSVKNFYGPMKKYNARLHDGETIIEQQQGICDFIFKDVAYHTSYRVTVSAFNGMFEGTPKMEDIDTPYDYTGELSARLSVVIFITCVLLAAAVYKVCIMRDVNDDVTPESTAVYVNSRVVEEMCDTCEE